MAVHNETESHQVERPKSKEIASPASKPDHSLIDASFGRPGDPTPSVLRTNSASRQNEFALGSKLDIPDIWRSQNQNSQMKPFEQGATNKAGDKPPAPAVESPDFRGQHGPASIRNNNPGAMYPGESAQKFGSTVTNRIGGGHLIAEFPNAVAGAAAQFDLLDSSKYRNMNVGDAIAKWSGHNGVSQYQQVLKSHGIDLHSKVGDIMQDKDKAIVLAKTMAKVEAGKDFPMGNQQWGAAYDKYKEHPPTPPRDNSRPSDGGHERPHHGADAHHHGSAHHGRHHAVHHGHHGGHHYAPHHRHHRRHR